MIFIAEKCTGCRNCQMMCSLSHDGECNPSLARVVMTAEGLRLHADFTPECDECARCAEYCPNGAIKEGE